MGGGSEKLAVKKPDENTQTSLTSSEPERKSMSGGEEGVSGKRPGAERYAGHEINVEKVMPSAEP